VAASALAAHQAAVQAGLAYLDAHASRSRKGTDGVEQVTTGGLAAALFDHRTSRAGDPQLHTHALVLNKARCADGVWRTLDGTELFGHKKTAGMIYQNALRNEMHVRLGVEFEPVSDNGQAEIRGIPAALLKLWSKRTAAIDAEAAPKIAEYAKLLGRTLSAAERVVVTKTAVLKTRPGKTHPELSTLAQTWTAEAAQLGWTPESLRAAAGVALDAPEQPGRQRQAAGAEPAASDRAARWPEGLAHGVEPVLPAADPSAGPDAELVLRALRAAGQRSAVFARTDVAGQIAAHLPTTGLAAAQALARIEALTDVALGLAEAVPVGRPVRGVTPRASDARFATAEVLQAEARILSLASRGRAGGYGQADHAHVRTAVAAGRLDDGQIQALVRLAEAGDFLSVLTAPAGAGKTSTLGATSQAWAAAGYRVVGLAPSARAATELSAATGGRADTLAKWLHNQDRLASLPPAERGWSALDDRTVLIVDEASMASTLDLDRLTSLAAKAAAKVVLVGDPGQIGVINGPGGMLAALAHAGHAVELDQIHRFTHPWERDASLHLRQGNPAVLGTYYAEGRLHPCPDSDTALDAVFTHWTQERQAGQDALMLARTRQDVDALNTRARAAALANEDVTGPVTTAGDRDWQAGDLLRTRRNNRSLVLSTGDDGHVRNGDRYRVLGPGPGGGLILEHLSGRGRLTLPADYLAEHCEYGWASTIDAAQGATADIGLVLVRPGLDREHLYVAMTRGRHANHAYITPDQPADPDHDHRHGPARGQGPRHAHGQDPAGRGQDPQPAHGEDGDGRRQDRRPPVAPQTDALVVLTQALGQSGAQDAAHTALANARKTATDKARHDRERTAAEAERQRRAPRPIPAEHTRTIELLDRLRQQRTDLLRVQDQLRATVRDSEHDLNSASRWSRARRRDLATTLTASRAQLDATVPQLFGLEQQIDQTTRLVDSHTRQRQAD
jgi:conjugative relaxase-like TrwC/TraI family protein